MKPSDVLRKKFSEWWAAPHSEFGTFFDNALSAFLAGANAAMDMHFEPGAVRFSPPDTLLSETPTPRQPLYNASSDVNGPTGHFDLGGEA